ncbi:hypothetical protein ACVL91_002347 [Bradyrhizobium elkanii]
MFRDHRLGAPLGLGSCIGCGHRNVVRRHGRRIGFALRQRRLIDGRRLCRGGRIGNIRRVGNLLLVDDLWHCGFATPPALCGHGPCPRAPLALGERRGLQRDRSDILQKRALIAARQTLERRVERQPVHFADVVHQRPHRLAAGIHAPVVHHLGTAA